MSSFSDYLGKKMLDHAFGGEDYTRPANVYVGLSTTEPEDDGSNITEPVGGNYARVELDNNLIWDAAVINTNGIAEKENNELIMFPEPTDNWGEITHFFLADDSAEGNILGTGEMPSPTIVENGDDPIVIDKGSLKITLD